MIYEGVFTTSIMNNLTTVKILANTFLATFVAGIGVYASTSYNPVKGDVNDVVDCEYYFAAENNYTSLHEIVGYLDDGITNVSYKTWGTVTKYYTDSSSKKNFYIQSTDRYGNIAGMMVYQSSLVVSEGNVLTIEGIPTLYNNLPEFVTPSVNVDYTVNSSPVTTYVTSESFWQNGSSSSSAQYLAAEAMGTRKVKLEDVTLSYVSSGNGSVQFSGGTTVPLYFYSLSNTSTISSYVQSLNGYTVDVTGYLDCFDNGYSAYMRLLVRSTSDIATEGFSYSVTLNSSTYGSIGSYSTGNYEQESVSGVSFEHYRAVSSYTGSDFIALLPYVNYFGDGSAAGALYNTSSISGIESIAISYRTSLSSGVRPVLSYGANIATASQVQLNLTTSNATSTIEISNANFFKVSTTESTLYIQSIVIEYNGSGPSDSYTYLGSGDGLYRINPIVNTESLYNGLSVAVPTSISRSGNYYTVTSTKNYTYYTFSYIQSNPGLADAAAHTNPLDVAAYFTTFGTYPANYVLKSSYSSAYSVFGDDARCVSVYSRTDGYATAVPYKADGSGYPQYYECDIDLDGTYSSNNRGVGRVVCWEYGFDPSKGATSYDASPVCVYTDDHYATFQEYLNTGSYGTRFNSEMLYTPYVWGAPTTLLA